MEKMGRFEDDMDSRVPSGSCSSASGFSLRSRGSSAKISPFCPRSSSKLTQSIIKDHMISHYKKVYSAKAAIDTSVPKSLLCSVKYNDQLKRAGGGGAGLKNGVRPQSAHSLSRRTTASCSPAQSRLSLHYDSSPFHSSSRSVSSTPRPSTSFHPKHRAYASLSPSSEQQRRSLRQRSAASLEEPQLHYRSFQDPAQKTYSGDLLQKHGQRFTDEQPFTPRTLKTDKSSYLSKYRFYRAPHCSSKDVTPQPDHGHKHKAHQSLSNGDCRQETEERPQSFSTDHGPTEDFNHSYVTAMRGHSVTHRSRQDTADSFHRVSYEAARSPVSQSVDAEEEELRYLEFITAVTDDILSRGFISDSVVERVINRHLDMNRYHLNEGKMRHLLDVLRKDLKEPCDSPINTLNFELEHHVPKSLLQKVNLEETRDETELSRSAFAVEKSDSIDFTDPVLTSSLTSPSSKNFLIDPIEISVEKRTVWPQLSKHNSFGEADIHGKQTDRDTSQSEQGDGLREQIQEVSAALESLNVSDQSQSEKEESEESEVNEEKEVKEESEEKEVKEESEESEEKEVKEVKEESEESDAANAADSEDEF